MASIARCLRVARPAAFSAVSRSSASRTPAARCFSVTAANAIKRYTKEHEWIDVTADKKTGVVGITEYAARQLGDIVYVELPEEGKAVAAGDAIGAVESVKSAADINAPISCKITQVNLLLEDKPDTINKVAEDDSHGGGWIAKVQLTEDGVNEFDALMDEAAYAEFTSEEGDH
ncbi:glycine cleavage H-protein-domain-containing protein [Staphylotrichum tortipilum]|uniref:Glycine cleavage system H protein n=1 Tax=Staphylotrichum tortipilum TaxID=2831512 RepID=A0AAN6MIS8_9PEZI|nr:glycine cleavage H-protein-domain-containing protein [Staphylotrichum longicolle]